MKPLLLASVLAAFCTNSLAQTIDSAQINHLIETYIPTATVGLIIQDAKTNEILFSQAEDHVFIPASVTKTLTTAASIIDLGPDFTYRTTLLQDAVSGDVGIVFTGDPSFTHADLNHLLQPLKELKTIKGDILIDNQYFSKPDTARGIVAEDLDWYFGAPAKTVIIDENQIGILLTPHSLLGQKVAITLTENEFPLIILNNVVTETLQASETLCQFNIEQSPADNALQFYGCWPAHEEQKTTSLKIALANPELRVKQIIQTFLHHNNITLKGEIKIAPVNLPQTLSTHDSASLPVLNAKIMQASNNIYADSLAKVLGKKHYQTGTLQTGSTAIMQILKNNLKVDLSDSRIYDGAGNSIYNRITPQSIMYILQAMYQSPQYRQAFLTSMQVMDETHTFYNRMPEAFIHPLYIKTGSMTGVSNVVGFITTQSGKTLILALFLNQLPADKSNTRLFEKELIKLLVGL